MYTRTYTHDRQNSTLDVVLYLDVEEDGDAGTDTYTGTNTDIHVHRYTHPMLIHTYIQTNA